VSSSTARVIRVDEPVAPAHQPLEAFAEGCNDQRIGRRQRQIVERKRWIDQSAAVEVEHHQRRYFVAVDAGNDDVAHQRRTGAQRSARATGQR
jgi:hypothetical protein